MQTLEALVAADPSDTSSRRLLAWSLNRVGRHEEALRQYRDLVELQPHDPQMHAGLGESLISLGRHAEGISALQVAAELDPTDPWVYHALGDSFVASGALQDALVAYRRLLVINPRDATAASNLGATLGRLEHWEDAVRYARQALEISPHVTTALLLSEALYRLKRYTECEDTLRTALQLEPDNTSAKLGLACVFGETHRPDEALAILDRLTDGRTVDGSALATLSHILRRKGDTSEALEVARTAVRVGSTLTEAHSVLGWALLMAGRPDEALSSFDRALELAAGETESTYDVDASAGRCGALSALGRHAAALTEFEEVLRKAPDYLDDDPELRPFINASRQAVSG